jgi:branched-chain amino acid transport system permease protein
VTTLDTPPAVHTPTGRAASRVLGWPVPGRTSIPVLVVLGALIPFVLRDGYWLGTLTLALIWIVLNQSWNLVLGYSGIWNFGQLAIYAIGGYTASMLSLRGGLPAWLALIAGGAVAMVASVVIAVPALRLRGIYVSLLTFGFAEVVRLLVIADQSGFTGGSFGLSNVPGYRLTDLDPQLRSRVYYWIAFGVVLLSSAVVFFVIRSPIGTALTALRDSPSLAAARGISPRRYQFVSFGISGFIAGVAGALYAFNYGVISPTVMGLGPLTLLVTMLVIGGLGTQTGPIVGTILLTLISSRLEQYPEVRLILLGAILLLIILLMPRGIVPLAAGLRRRVSRWVSEDRDDEVDGEAGDESEAGPDDDAPAGDGRPDDGEPARRQSP